MTDEQAIASVTKLGLQPDRRLTRPPRPTFTNHGLTGPADYHNPALSAKVDGYDAAQNEWWLSPRPGHVFMVLDYEQAYGPLVVRVDLRSLDPGRVKPDDDFWRDNVCEETGEHTLGEYMNEIGWGDNPADTAEGGFEHGVICHQGTIPPAALDGFFFLLGGWRSGQSGAQSYDWTFEPWRPGVHSTAAVERLAA